ACRSASHILVPGTLLVLGELTGIDAEIQDGHGRPFHGMTEGRVDIPGIPEIRARSSRTFAAARAIREDPSPPAVAVQDSRQRLDKHTFTLAFIVFGHRTIPPPKYRVRLDNKPSSATSGTGPRLRPPRASVPWKVFIGQQALRLPRKARENRSCSSVHR